MTNTRPADGGPLYRGWRILPIATPVDDRFTARYELRREPQGGAFIPVTTWDAPGTFATTEEAWAGAIRSAVAAIDSSPA